MPTCWLAAISMTLSMAKEGVMVVFDVIGVPGMMVDSGEILVPGVVIVSGSVQFKFLIE